MTAAIVDNFNRADNASSLGTTSDGTATWTTLSGTCGISSNQAYGPSAPGFAKVPADADGTVQATIVLGGAGTGPAFRIGDASNYWAIFAFTGGSVSHGLWKVVAGASTHVSTFAMANGDVVSISFAGSHITVRQNGSTVATVTDSALSTNTGVGIQLGQSADRIDSFSFTPVVPPNPVRIAVRSRAITRASVI